MQIWPLGRRIHGIRTRAVVGLPSILHDCSGWNATRRCQAVAGGGPALDGGARLILVLSRAAGSGRIFFFRPSLRRRLAQLPAPSVDRRGVLRFPWRYSTTRLQGSCTGPSAAGADPAQCGWIAWRTITAWRVTKWQLQFTPISMIGGLVWQRFVLSGHWCREQSSMPLYLPKTRHHERFSQAPDLSRSHPISTGTDHPTACREGSSGLGKRGSVTPLRATEILIAMFHIEVCVCGPKRRRP